MRNFNDLYNEVLKSSKEELESLRKGCLYRILVCVIVGIVSVIVGFFLQNIRIMQITLFVCIVLGIILLIGPANKYKKTYKEKVIQKFIKAYSPDLEYNYNQGISRMVYIEGEFEHFDKYSSEDLIVGKIDNYDVMIGEVHTQNEYEDDDGHTHYSTVFHGLFGMSTLTKLYNGVTKIHSDKGFLSKIFDSKKRIEMDSSEFEKYFDVFADDKIQAMQILTSDIMDLMLNFLRESKIKFEITIKRDKLFIRFKTGEMFEGNIMKSSVDFETLKKVFDIINFTFDVTIAMTKTAEETQI